MLIHLRNYGLNPAVTKTYAKIRWSTLLKALDWSKLISTASVPSSTKGVTYLTIRLQHASIRGLDGNGMPTGKPLVFFLTRSRVRFHSLVEDSLTFTWLIQSHVKVKVSRPRSLLASSTFRESPSIAWIVSSIDFTFLVLFKLSCWPYLAAKSLILCLRDNHPLFSVTAPTNPA